MAIDERNIDQREMDERLKKARRPGSGIGLLKGMLVTLKHLFKHNTVIEYPDEKQDLPPRTRGVIALKEENCTVCMLCGREFEYAEYDIRELTHEKERLSDWMATVLPPPPLEQGALLPGQPEPEAPAATAQPAAAATTPATTASPATATSSAAEARPEQAAEAPKAPTAVPTAATEAAPAPAAAQPEVTEIPTPTPAPPAPAGPDRLQETTPLGTPMSSEESEAVYKQVLEEQLAKGSSPTVAEARARVARAKAERGIGRPPTPIAVDKPVPSAPTKAESKEPTPSGAPRAEEPQPPQGPVAPTPADEDPE